MKLIRIVIVIIVTCFVFFFAFHKSNKISLEGNWDAKEIVLDGKQIFPREINKYLGVGNEISVSDWDDTIIIPNDNDKIAIKYLATKNVDRKYQVELRSTEKSLNGIFELRLDTIVLGPNFIEVEVEIKSKKSWISFKRRVDTTPRKPELPRKGLV